MVAHRGRPAGALELGGVRCSTAPLRSAVGPFPRSLRRERHPRSHSRTLSFPSSRRGQGRLLVIRLETDELSALHLIHQANLDALDLDDRISTGRLDRLGSGADPLLSTCQALSDAVFDWWEGAPPPLVYRTRTLPAARSMAFTRAVGWTTSGSRRLSEATGLLAALVTRHGFTVPGHWLA